MRSGDVVAQIAPSDSPAIAKALVESEDIRKVEKGQEVQMRVSSCSYTEYGTLKGKVSSISPDVMKPQTPNSCCIKNEILDSSLHLL